MGAVNVKGTNYTLVEAASPSAKVDAHLWGGRVRVQCDEYEADAVEAGSTIKMARLPKGAVPLSISKLMFDALGTGATIAIGDGTTATKFKAATSVATAGSMNLDAIGAVGAQLTAETDIVLTTAGATISGTIKLETYYSMP